MTFDGFRSRWITPLRVGVGDRLGDLLEDRQEPSAVPRRLAALVQERGEGPPADQLHGEERPPGGVEAQLVDRQDPGVLQLAADLGLLDQPADHRRVGDVLGPEDLQGDLPPQVPVVALEHDADPAPGEFPGDLVSAGARAGPDATADASGDQGWTTPVGPSSGSSRSRMLGVGPLRTPGGRPARLPPHGSDVVSGPKAARSPASRGSSSGDSGSACRSIMALTLGSGWTGPTPQVHAGRPFRARIPARCPPGRLTPAGAAGRRTRVRPARGSRDGRRP